MTSYVPPVKNSASGWIGYVSLAPRTANGQWQSNPTLAAGDVKISIDGGALANLTTLPAVTPASSKLVKITLSQAETNGDNLTIIFSDAAGAEWCDLTINLQTVARQINDLAFPTVSGRSLDVTATGAAGIDWGNIENPTTAVNLSATNIDVDQVVASVSGAVGSVAGAVGSVIGAVGSVAAGGITAASIATGAIDADALAADAIAEIADGVWDEDATAHQTGGSFGQAIGDPGADTTSIYQSVVTDAAGTNIAADIIAVKAQTAAIETDTAEIGAAGAGLTALATQASVDAITALVDTEVAAILAAVDTEVAAIKVKTDNLPASPAATGDAMTLTAAAIDAIHDEVIEGTLTFRQSMRLQNSTLFGLVSGGNTTTVTFRNIDNTLDRIVATVDSDGNRTALVTDVS